MRFGIDVGGELKLKLHQAVLVYRNERGTRHMATVHGVVQGQDDGAPVLGAGQLLTTSVLRELARGLGTVCPVEVLPEQVVARTPEVLAWWRRAATRPMFFRADSELGELSGRSFLIPPSFSWCAAAPCIWLLSRRAAGPQLQLRYSPHLIGIPGVTAPCVRGRCGRPRHPV